MTRHDVTDETTRGQSIRVDYVAGSFRGEGRWGLQNIGGKTRLTYRWQADPAGFLKLLAHVAHRGQPHHSH
jgi:hypothetical protein